MIDFKNASYIKLRQVDPSILESGVTSLLIPNEVVVSGYKGIRDYVVFTQKRIIAVNVQGLTGKKKDFRGKYKGVEKQV